MAAGRVGATVTLLVLSGLGADAQSVAVTYYTDSACTAAHWSSGEQPFGQCFQELSVSWTGVQKAPGAYLACSAGSGEACGAAVAQAITHGDCAPVHMFTCIPGFQGFFRKFTVPTDAPPPPSPSSFPLSFYQSTSCAGAPIWTSGARPMGTCFLVPVSNSWIGMRTFSGTTMYCRNAFPSNCNNFLQTRSPTNLGPDCKLLQLEVCNPFSTSGSDPLPSPPPPPYPPTLPSGPAVPLIHADHPPAQPDAPLTNEESSGGMDGGAIAGLVLGIIAFFLLPLVFMRFLAHNRAHVKPTSSTEMSARMAARERSIRLRV
ncbi:hypothetical protein AB1Y20_018133 [Prymnesium parvum]|uniref:Uncharacterized protein n=1 Tax=Prymnesium parvum TaxID=97485 RepID=A0AB34JR14_PRYPA